MFDEEHHGPSLPETSAEVGFRYHWFSVAVLATACFGGNKAWVAGALAVLGLVGFGILLANREMYVGSQRALAVRLAGWMLPVWVALAVLAVGLNHRAYHLIADNGQNWWELLPLPAAWLPVAGPLAVAGFDVLVTVGLFTATLSALLLCKNRMVFARTWTMLVFSAGVFATLGLAQAASHAGQILWIIPIDNLRFFATFPQAAQWCAFALLWLGAALGMIAWLVRQRGWRWLADEGWGLLASAIVLLASIVVAGDPLHVILAILVSAIGSLVIAWQTRAERVRAKRPALGPGVLAWSVAGLVFFGGVALVALRHPVEEWINYAGGGAAMHARVIEDTQSMWRVRPWFGWGAGSFRVVYSFFQGADQSPLYVAYARSDLWQSLAEHGLIGTAAWCAPVLWVLGRLVWRRRLATFLIAPLAGILAVAVLAVADFPLACPVVFFSFWLILFSLGRWSELDLEDKSSVPSEKRRVEKLRAEGKTLPPKTAPAAPTPARPS